MNPNSHSSLAWSPKMSPVVTPNLFVSVHHYNTEKNTGSISPAGSSRLNPQTHVITLKTRGNKIVSEVSVSILMCEHTHCTVEYQAATLISYLEVSRRKLRNVRGSLNHSALTLQNLSAQLHHLFQSAMAEFPLGLNHVAGSFPSNYYLTWQAEKNLRSRFESKQA